MSDRTKWTIEIRRYGGDETDPGFRRMHTTSEHDAYRINRGANINLNHRDYYTIVIPPVALRTPAERRARRQDREQR